MAHLDYETLSEGELEQLRACSLGKEVELGAIEGELSALWEADGAASRASMMNFAIYNEKIGALLENTRLISEITREHACRALLIVSLREKAQPRIRSWITAHCRLDQDGCKIACSEQISFLVESDQVDLIRNIVFAHLDSDLPLVLWWQGELSSTFEERLYSRIDRLVFDSAQWADPARGYRAIASALDQEGTRFAIHDLAWARGHQMRLAFASLFDDRCLADRAGAIESLNLRCSPDQRVAALLLVAWIATQCGWSLNPDASDNQGIVYHAPAPHGGRRVRARVELLPGGAPLELLQAEGSGFSVSLRRQGESTRFLRKKLCMDGRERTRMLPLDSDDTASLVTRQLMRSDDSLLRKILPALLKLLDRPISPRG
ncbi:MAG: glucose-6-phosphate dehydrogenase assembly protein OpcA [Verrucomicrobiales bacterium]